jgi:hypothetical protein
MDILLEIEEFEDGIDQVMFNRSINFMLALDPDILTDKQLEDLSDIISQIEFLGGGMEEAKRAKKSLSTIKQYSRSYYRKNKISLKGKKERVKNTVDGRKRKRNKKKNAKRKKSPGGRNQIIYNTQGHVN